MSSSLTYWLANHPTITNFRWSPTHSYGSTWPFLISSLLLYLLLSLLLHLLLRLLHRQRPIPLGPIPVLHSLLMSLVSAITFLGLLTSSFYEFNQTRWLWRRTGTNSPLQWLLCFPLGTRPSGRVFFWSYVFYLSRYLHLFRTFLSILRCSNHALTRLFSHSAMLCMSFVWLEFSQSFQVVAILSASLVNMVVFGYRFWVGVGLPGGGTRPSCFRLVIMCQVGLLGCNLAGSLGFLVLHFFGKGGGCNGVGAWLFNSVLNAGLFVLFLNCYLRKAMRRRRGLVLEDDDDDCGSHHFCRQKHSLSDEKNN